MKSMFCAQGSPEWFEARCGAVTSSRVADAIAILKRKEGEAAVRRNLRYQIVGERLTGLHADSYVSAAMEWGVENEPLARTAYEMFTGEDVKLIGYVLHDSIEYAGASPDGLVGTEGMIECKCPNTITHLGYLVGEVVPDEYKPQMLWQMACTGRKWCDFVSFDPRLPERHQLFVTRFQRDEAEIDRMTAEVIKFLAEVDAMIAKLPRSTGESSLERQLLDSMELTQQDVETVFPQ